MSARVYLGEAGNQVLMRIVSNDPHGFSDGLAVQTEATDHFYTYAQTFVARMGLALGKHHHNNARGAFRTVPRVPFDRTWTDTELATEIGLTQEEMLAIYQALPDYHHLLPQINNSRRQPGDQNNDTTTMGSNRIQD